MSGYSQNDTIGSWTVTQFVKFLRDLFQNQPPDFLPNLKVEDIEVHRTLTLRDKIAFSREAGFRAIGGTGNPTFANSWVNFGSGWQVAAFWKDPFGNVRLRGLIKSGTVGQRAFTLPPGFRPFVSETFGTISNGAFGRVSIYSDGTVVPESPSNNTYVSLSGITFRTS